MEEEREGGKKDQRGRKEECWREGEAREGGKKEAEMRSREE